MRKFLLGTVLALAVPVGAHALPSYYAVAQVSISGNPNGVWSYGYGTPGSSFTAFSYAGTGCLGMSLDY